MKFIPALRIFLSRNSSRRHQQEPADMGTAYGMEAILAEGDAQRASVSAVELESRRAEAEVDSPLAWLIKRTG